MSTRDEIMTAAREHAERAHLLAARRSFLATLTDPAARVATIATWLRVPPVYAPPAELPESWDEGDGWLYADRLDDLYTGPMEPPF